jgi:hypothetical protein
MNHEAATRRVLRLAGTALTAAILALAHPVAATALPPPAPAPACSRITSFSPPAARPGQEVDIFIEPGSGPQLPYRVSGVQFANGITASFVRVTLTPVRARVPLAGSSGRLRVQCTSLIGGTRIAESATDFSPVAFGISLNPTAVDRFVGEDVTVTATLSHPAPEPVVLTIAPQSTRVAVNGQNPEAADNVTIPMGQQSVSFTATARAPGVGVVRVSGHNVTSADLTISIPQPSLRVTVPVTDAIVNWGNSASYTVELESENGFAGTSPWTT